MDNAATLQHLIAVGFVLTIVPYYMWWGGASVPARFLVPALPMVAPTIAMAFDRCRGAASRGVSGLLLMASVVSFAAVVYQTYRRLLFNEWDGSGRLVEAIQGGVDLTVLLSSFVQADWVSQLPHVAGWLVAGMIAGAVAFVAGSRQVTLRLAFWSGAFCLVGFVMAGSLVSGDTLTRHGGGDVVARGQQGVIAAYDGDRFRAYSYRDRRLLGDAELFARATVSQRPTSRLPVPGSGRPQVERGRCSSVRMLFQPVVTACVSCSTRGSCPPRAGGDEAWVAYHRGPDVLSRSPVTSSR